MRREQAIKEIEAAGATAVVSQFLKFSFDGGTTVHTFFPNHYENMRRGEVHEYVMSLKPSVVERKRPKQ